jgi:hypothetical protein
MCSALVPVCEQHKSLYFSLLCILLPIKIFIFIVFCIKGIATSSDGIVITLQARCPRGPRNLPLLQSARR